MTKNPHKLTLQNDLLGIETKNTSVSFFGNDSEKLYNTNLNNQPIDWYYRDREISYKFNEYGHRCPNISVIDCNNYILFTGDSFSMGVGLELETTYPYIVSKNLDLSYYNLGLGGTGLDTMMYNLNAWFLKYPKPKFVVIYYSDVNRFLIKEKNTDTFTGINAMTSEENCKQLIYYSSVTGYFNTRYRLYKQTISLLEKKYNIPFYHISFDSKYHVHLENIQKFKFIDYARDFQHAGVNSHKAVAEYIVSDYTDKYMNATINSITRG